MQDSTPLLVRTDFPAIQRKQLTTLQVNLGYLCNLSCVHCHVNAGPQRTELASRETVDAIIAFAGKHSIQTLDVTGGAPEMNPHFRYLVEQVSAHGISVIDRCNLTILNEPSYEWLGEFLKQHKVQVVASLPCYAEQNVRQQRGRGVFESSIEALQKLNSLGYGIDEDLQLNLVYNPNGAFLPPNQQALQDDYSAELNKKYGIHFHQLFTLANMPIQRFGATLLAKNAFDEYLALLKNAYSESNLDAVMCKQLISVDWQGFVYDCDFNQMLNWPLQIPVEDRAGMIASDASRLHLNDLALHWERYQASATDESLLQGNPIVIGEHCYGCTAGQGSSCGGALN